MKFTTGASLIPEKSVGFHKNIDFNYCTNHDPHHLGFPFGLYLVTIRVNNGKKANKSINLGNFRGYIYVGVPHSSELLSSGLLPNQLAPTLFIRKGNPLRDKDIPLEMKKKLKDLKDPHFDQKGIPLSLCVTVSSYFILL